MKLLTPIVTAESVQTSKQEQKQKTPATTHNDWQEHGQCRASAVDFMRLGDSDTIRHDIPNHRDQSPATRDQLKGRSGSLGEGNYSKGRFETLLRPAKQHQR